MMCFGVRKFRLRSVSYHLKTEKPAKKVGIYAVDYNRDSFKITRDTNCRKDLIPAKILSSREEAKHLSIHAPNCL